MEEQSSREFASADAAAGAQDAAVQEPGFSPEISFHTRRRLQHLQRPTPSRLSPHAPRASRRGDDHVADRSRGGLTIPEAPTLCARGTVTLQNRRKTGYKWLERYESEGPAGLAERSRAPASHCRATPEHLAHAIVALRRERP